MTLKSDAKFEEKLTCALENDMRSLANFHQSTRKVSKLGLWWDAFIQSRKSMGLKFTGELHAMTMKKGAKSEIWDLSFKTDINNSTNFDLSTQKSQKFAFEWAPFELSIWCLS